MLEHGFCRGIVTADVLVEGLSRRAIATSKLKGVNQDKGHGVCTGLAPCGEGNGLIQFEVGLLMSRLPGSESA